MKPTFPLTPFHAAHQKPRDQVNDATQDPAALMAAMADDTHRLVQAMERRLDDRRRLSGLRVEDYAFAYNSTILIIPPSVTGRRRVLNVVGSANGAAELQLRGSAPVVNASGALVISTSTFSIFTTGAGIFNLPLGDEWGGITLEPTDYIVFASSGAAGKMSVLVVSELIDSNFVQ